MPRDYKVYLEDILEAIGKVSRYTVGLSQEAFSGDEKTLDAVVRNLEVIGEAIKKVPGKIRSKYPEVEWKKIAGLRDILIHEYSGIDSCCSTISGRSSPAAGSAPVGPLSREDLKLICFDFISGG